MMRVFMAILCSLLAVCSVSARNRRHEGTDEYSELYCKLYATIIHSEYVMLIFARCLFIFAEMYERKETFIKRIEK